MDFSQSPVRSLDSILKQLFDTNPNISKAMKEHNLTIEIIPDKFIRPHINLAKGIITLSYPYMDYVWYFCFAFFVMQELINKKLIATKQNGEAFDYQINLDKSEEGKQVKKCLFQCDQILNLQKTPTPSDLIIDQSSNITAPCNESLSSDIKYYQEKVNSIYIRAITCTLLHEIGHAVNRHHEVPITLPEDKKPLETEADNFALDTLFQGSNKETLNNAFGALFSFMSMFFMETKETVLHSITHPMIHDRCDRCITKFQDTSPDSTDDINNLYQTASQVALIFLEQKGIKVQNLDAGSDVKAYYKNLMNTIDQTYS